MQRVISTITLPMPYKLGSVNAFLVQTDTSYVLIDTGPAPARTQLEQELERAGCTPGSLELIVITHGDFDHTGNAAHLRTRFETRIAMHPDDLGMVERGDMFSNRTSAGILLRSLVRRVAPILFRFSKADRFVPDFYLQDGYDLAPHGFDAQVLRIPGHSKGSIGILTAGGELFCGDLFENRRGPSLGSLIDDSTAANASVQELTRHRIRTVYPGHGEPFPFEELSTDQR